MKLIDKVKPEILDALKESRISYKASYSVMITDLRKGLDWFRMNNAEAYMVLLD